MGELYYLRILLNTVKGVTSYEDIRTVDKVLHATSKDACFTLGLLDDDKEYVDGIKEASLWGSGHFFRSLFVTMLTMNCISSPINVWELTWHLLSEDILHRQQLIRRLPDLQLTDDQLKNYALAEIEKIMNRRGKSLKNFDGLPFPDVARMNEGRNNLIHDVLAYDRVLLTQESKQLIDSFNNEQKMVYDTLMNVVVEDKGGVFFVYRNGGTGKTFVWGALSSSLRSKGEIVLTVASSGIAALLMPGGRTAHSRFGIPLFINEGSICNINQGSELAELISKTRLIIWDEAPMVYKHCFEALDRTFRDILRSKNKNSENLPFGGKVIVFGGDFRQILPVVVKGRRQDTVQATLNSSYLWSVCKVLKLTKNMRLQFEGHDKEVLKNFSEWILNIGDGVVGGNNDGESIFDIPDDILIKDPEDPLGAIVKSTYPNLFENSTNSIFMQERAILSTTLEVVNKVNEYVMSSWPGEEVTCLSSDSICKADEF